MLKVVDRDESILCFLFFPRCSFQRSSEGSYVRDCNTLQHRGHSSREPYDEFYSTSRCNRAGVIAKHCRDCICRKWGSFPRVVLLILYNSSSVLSPADHPAVFSVGSTRHGHGPLMSSSRGYRHHSIQRDLPQFFAPGYEIPALSASNACKAVSGTSVSAPILAGKLGLVLEWAFAQGWHPSVGEMKCLMLDEKYDRKRECCVFPSYVQYPRNNTLIVTDAWFSMRIWNKI